LATQTIALVSTDGGVVAEILVTEGAAVKAGEILIRLDGSQLRSEIAIIENQLFELAARRARLEAERDEAEAVSYPAGLLEVAAKRPDVAGIVDGQTSLFAAQKEALDHAVDQRQERIEQIASQIAGIKAQAAATDTQIALLSDELATQKALLDKGLAQAAAVAGIQGRLAEAQGRAGELQAAMAEASGRITEIKIEITGLGTQQREEAEVELRDVVARELELSERQRSLAERIARLEIRAPAAGIVLGLLVTTPQSVIRPADALMYVVPQDRPLLVAVRVAVSHVDEVRAGQAVRLVFSSLPTRTTPEITGHVTVVSADALTDERSGAAFFRTEIAIDPDALQKLRGVRIVPGMPVEAFIRTVDRSPLSYLLKPFTDYFRAAFRET
ncbi:MAG TPA: HlyD family type I secretion periplasmic adaptor subunit, partial [Tabrizicola sp.]|nr:HlyD family type I secretion periplasmic adaptor subunit [Tabrizicola sp.]